MKLKMLFFERGHHLYRGYGLEFPFVIWLPLERRWGKISEWFKGAKRHETEWLSEKEAERCYPGSTSAPLPKDMSAEKEFDYPDLVKFRPDLFDDYDFRSIRRSPSENRAADNLLNEIVARKL